MTRRVCAFTDTYLPTVNGVTYTIQTWKEHWNANGGRMDVVYPSSDGYAPDGHEHPVASVSFPFYEGYRLGVPSIPDDLDGADVVHAHTPFSLGIAALRYVRRTDRPFVASYHTPAGEYTSYLAPVDPLARYLSTVSRRYEGWFFEHADVVLAPTETAATYLTDDLEISTPIEVVSNGVDLDRFSPVDGADFRDRYDLPEGPLIGYTGRHGYEKRLETIIDVVAEADGEWSVVFAGSGPATSMLEEAADRHDVDATFLGFLERDDLPSFYSALDVFAFPSPIETQGLVAMESIACGTPVVAVDTGALRETVEEGVTGYRYPEGDTASFRGAIRRALDEREALSSACLEAREGFGLDGVLDDLERVYRDVDGRTTG